MTLPKFGHIDDLELKFTQSMGDFDIEMFWFSKPSNSGKERLYVRILHITTSQANAQPEMNKIKQYLSNREFNIDKHEIYEDSTFKTEWIGADVILFGTDNEHYHLVDDILQAASRGLFAAILRSDILVYNTDTVFGTRYTGLFSKYQFSDMQFSDDSICILYGHIRRYLDSSFRDVLALSGWAKIEDCIDDVCVDAHQKSGVGKKKAFKEWLQNNYNNYDADNVELLLLAMDIIREHRNQTGHRNDPGPNQRKAQAIKDYNVVAARCNFKSDLRGFYKHDMVHEHRKWISYITKMVVRWFMLLQQGGQSLQSKP